MKTSKGKNMPVDWDARFIDDELFSIPAGHRSHFETCPNAYDHRGKSGYKIPIHDSNDEGPIKKKLAEIPSKHHDSPGLFDDEVIQ
ncbi:MAG: hypothetical protein V3W20_08340 [Candidatus Neomarinimicrobiota bacterium]